jgi:hypothetical protein
MILTNAKAIYGCGFSGFVFALDLLNPGALIWFLGFRVLCLFSMTPPG